MLNRPEPACLVIADITGYTSFLAGAELDHAQDILADLIGTVVTSLRPRFKLAKLEGDAAFVHAMGATIDGPLLQDTIERCYFAFRRRLRDIRQASACECNACILVPNLDLKVVAHHGEVIRQRIASSTELLGSPVIVVHRLLKNDVEARTKIGAYALYTDACVAAMGLDDPAAAGLVEHREAFEGVGEIRCWIADLGGAWQAELTRTRRVISPEESARTYEIVVDAPASVAWEYVTSPVRRPLWQHGVTEVSENAASAGRRGIGTVNHCMHGRDAVIEEVVDWEPGDHVTYRSQLPDPSLPKMMSTFLFEDLDGGRSRVEARFENITAPKYRAAAEAFLPALDAMMTHGFETLRDVIAAAAQDGEATAEPELPVSQGRNASEPIAAATS